MSNQRSIPLKHWGLERWPFSCLPGVQQFYPTTGHNEALARIEHLVDGRRRLGVLIGENGVGKSLVLRVAASQLARSGSAVVLAEALGTTTRELLWQIACGLYSTPRDDADAHWLWRQIADRVAENRVQQRNTVLLVDDAGQAGPDMVTQLTRLARLDATPAARWTIVLAADPGQAMRWNESLRNLVDLRIDVTPWQLEDTIGYVQTALVDAGRFEPLFEEAALTRLHELSAGVPRSVARLADYALLAGAAAAAETIDAEIIEAASDEIAWPTSAAAY
jgi:type II secretory pathway predicted ATPase ExeA